MGTHPIFESDFDCLTERKKYLNMDDLDAQLAELQRQLRQEVKKSQSDFDWPEAPELDLNSIPPIPEPIQDKPIAKEVAKPVAQKENKTENKKVKFATNEQAE